MTDGIRINIPRPYPGTDENAKQITFIEPLREHGRAFVTAAYYYNLDQHEAGKEPSLSPGFRYEFVFPNDEDATAFKIIFGGEEVK